MTFSTRRLPQIVISFGFALFLTGPIAIAGNAPVLPIETHTVGEIRDPELRERVRALRSPLINLELTPELKPTLKGLAALLKKIIRDKDGNAPIYLAILDDINVNASFQTLENGLRLITINLGTLGFVESDDELAFVLGHELEHGTATLQTKVDGLRAQKEFAQTAYAAALKRTVENEVDARSVIGRVHHSGFNPHAASHFLERMRREVGDWASKTHTHPGSRVDSIAMAITHLRRNTEERVQDDVTGHFSRSLIAPIQRDYLRRKDFRTRQLLRAESVFHLTGNPAAPYLQAVVSQDYSALEPVGDEMGDYYPQRKNMEITERISIAYRLAYVRGMSTVRRLAWSLLDKREKIAIQLRLHYYLDSLFEQAIQAMPDDFQPHSLDQIWQLKTLFESRPYIIEGLNIADAFQRICRAEFELGQIEKNPVLEQAVRQELEALHRGNLKSAQEDYSILLPYYEGSAEEIHEILANPQHWISSSRQPGAFPYERPNWQIGEKLKIKVISRFIDRNIENGAALDRFIFPVVWRNVGSFKNLSESFKAFLRLDRKFVSERLRGLVQLSETAARQALSNAMTQDEILKALINCREILKFYHVYLSHGHPQAIADFKNIYRMLLSHGKRLSTQTPYLFQGINEFQDDIDQLNTRDNAPLSFKMGRKFGRTIFSDVALGHEILADFYRRHPLLKIDAKMITPETMIEITGQTFPDLAVSKNTYSRNHDGSFSPYVLSPIETLDVAVKALFGSILSVKASVPAENFTAFLTRQQGSVLQGFHWCVNFIRNLMERRTGHRFSDAQARSLLLVLRPDIFSLLPQDQIPSVAASVDGLVSLLRIPSVHAVLKTALTFDKLVVLFENQGQTGFELFRELGGLLTLDTGTPRAVNEFRFRLDFAAWLRKQDVVDFDLISRMVSPRAEGNTLPAPRVVPEFLDYSPLLLEERYQHYLSTYQALPLRERTKLVMRNLWSELRHWTYGDWPVLNLSQMAEVIARWTPSDPRDKADFVLGHLDALQELALIYDPGIDFFAPPHGNFDPRKINAQLDRFSEQFLDGTFHERLSLEQLSELLAHMLRFQAYRPSLDHVFEYFWERTSSRPDLRRRLSDEFFVGRLHYNANRLKLARWQIDDRFRIEELGREIRTSASATPKIGAMRKTISQVRNMIDQQFSGLSSLKNEMLTYVENTLITNATETKYLQGRRLTSENWQDANSISALDIPRMFGNSLDTKYDQLALIYYLTGIDQDMPTFVARNSSGKSRENLEDTLRISRRHFMEADIHARTYTLQPLLDSQTGVFSDQAALSSLIDRILGTHAQDPIFRTLFSSYLDSLAESERRIIMGHILGSFADQNAAQRRQGRVSIKSILEAMGPFGIKAGQFLRSSGLVNESLRAELNDFFDSALPPVRHEIFSKLKEVFGQYLAHFVSVRQLVGSGSINYVVLADMNDPNTGKSKRVVIRILRQAVEGRVANENTVWQKTIAHLNLNSDPDVRRVSRLLEEARGHSMETLGHNGAELNLEFDRSLFEDALAAYRHPKDLLTGYSIDVVSPDESLQRLVPKQYSKSISVYGYIENTPLDQISDLQLRENLVRMIVDAELEALLQRGVFDPDGHPGNWLVESSTQRIVRIDHSQLRRMSRTALNAFRGVLTALISPVMGEPEIETIANNFLNTFHVTGPLPALEPLLRLIITQENLPSFTAPQERLFFIRDELEKKLHAQPLYAETLLRIKDTPRSGLASLSRVLIYRERIGDMAMAQALLNQLSADQNIYVPTTKVVRCEELIGEAREN